MLPQPKVVYFDGPGSSTATNATSATYVDRLGFDYAIIDVVHQPATDTDSSAKWIALNLLHSDDATNTSNVTGASGTTNSTASSSQFVLPAYNDTSYGAVIRFHVDCRGKGRYLHVSKTPCASHTYSANCANLYRAEELPNTTTEEGTIANVFV